MVIELLIFPRPRFCFCMLASVAEKKALSRDFVSPLPSLLLIHWSPCLAL
ncbi:hypothetical protein V6Z11_D10G014200 [Gossypium hirsutum]